MEGSASEAGAYSPILVEAPGITGTFVSTRSVTVGTGVWESEASPTFTYQWYLDDVAIPSATANAYVIQVGDIGKSLSVTVTATNTTGANDYTSSPTVVAS